MLLTVRHEALLDPPQQLAFYFCAARHPLIPDDIDHGYTLRRMLSREQCAATVGSGHPIGSCQCIPRPITTA